MKRNTLLIIALFVMASMTVLLAAEKRSSKVVYTKGDVSVMIDSRRDEGSVAHDDRVILKDGSKAQIIFRSGGRAVADVLEADFDADGSSEFLVVMNLGGSADYRELSLLKSSNGKYSQIWEETGFSGGKISIVNDYHDRKDPVIVISYFTDTEPAKEAAAFFYMENGTVKQGS